MNVKYFSLYEEKDGGTLTYYIPIRESKTEYATQGFVFIGKWEYNTSLVSPEDWEEFRYSDREYLKIINMNKAPKKEELIFVIFEILGIETW